MQKEFDSELADNGKYLKMKIKSYGVESIQIFRINADFHDDKMLKEGSECICWSAIVIDSVFKFGKNHYSQVFLEESKYKLKERKMII